MDFRALAARIMEGRGEYLASSVTAYEATISSLALTTTPLTIRSDGMIRWDNRLTQVGSVGTRKLEAFIREFLQVAAPYQVVQWEYTPTLGAVPKEVKRAPYFTLN